ncbi:MAG: ABC transporter substrate-binding protein [Solirubrobacterales bacterium]|nr:ABC transporter substrate-binding protein [Solirubrobacterales bacterium]
MPHPRRTAAALAALAATLALGACGAEEPAEGGDDSAATDAGSFPVTIEHKFGSTEILAPPERVVSVGYTDQDTVLALGVEPVGVREFIGGYDYRHRPWAEGLENAEPQIVGAEQISFERVAAARPDLIIAINSGITEGDYDRLSRIAPTIAQSGEFIDFGMPWQDQTLAVGRALGREQRARELVDEVEERFARAREEHPEFEGASFVLGYGDAGSGFGAYASQDTRVRFFEALGFASPPQVDELAGDGFFVDFDEEQLALLDQDAVVMFGPREEIADHPVFRRLDAAREERVVYLDLEDQVSGALGFGSPLSLPYLLDEVLPQLAAAVDGDPTTTEPEPE